MSAIGPRDAARAAGVSTSTLRHYERIGLLHGVHRTAAGYRRYSPKAVERVLLIRRALVIGFSLRDVRRILSVRDTGGAPCHNVRSLVAARLDALTAQMADLQALETELRALLAEWDQRLAGTPSGQRAHLLESLASRPGVNRFLRTTAASRDRRSRPARSSHH
jgi:DNA-binding transcriptional MerR regulator